MNSISRVDLEPAYVLHARSYRETSTIIEVFTPGSGRIGLVARGSRRPRSPLRGLLNPFQALRLSWSGRGDLATLRHAEPGGDATQLPTAVILSGFYVNELLLRLVHRHDPHAALFGHYSSLIAGLSAGGPVETLLRTFELELLREIGFELNLERDAISQEPLREDQYYEFRVEQGAVPVQGDETDRMCFTGAELLTIAQGNFDDANCLVSAKRLLRMVLDYHVGDKGLKTRRVAAAMRR
jgi:DNA repair protein RecO (recombination protein O)